MKCEGLWKVPIGVELLKKSRSWNCLLSTFPSKSLLSGLVLRKSLVFLWQRLTGKTFCPSSNGPGGYSRLVPLWLISRLSILRTTGSIISWALYMFSVLCKTCQLSVSMCLVRVCSSSLWAWTLNVFWYLGVFSQPDINEETSFPCFPLKVRDWFLKVHQW